MNDLSLEQIGWFLLACLIVGGGILILRLGRYGWEVLRRRHRARPKGQRPIQPTLLERVMAEPFPESAPAAAPTTAQLADQPGPAAQQEPGLPASPVGDGAMPREQWLERLNDRPDQHPHAAITGPTGAGKTTVASAILERRRGRLVITSLKNADDDPWGGAEVVRLGKGASFQPIQEAIAAVYQEMLRRHDEGSRDAEDITLVIDDLSVVAADCDIMPMVLKMWTLARSCRIRLVVLDTEENVRAWGIEGRGATRHNLIFVRCHLDEDTGERTATLGKHSGRHRPMDISDLGATKSQIDLSGRGWHPPTQAYTSMATVAGSRAEYGDTGMAGISSILHQEAIPDDADSEGVLNIIPGRLTPDAILTLSAAGWSHNKIAGLLTGAKQKRLETIKAVLATADQPAA